ncbi:hypothetical protein SADUNF_Sadunf07G0074300 [Salix dunnii]|uniref:Transcription factor CBF/NF-Y/archaeal histone domain-containing protein n=1 Tax=Salix dunnii TaxID=1413687 RepID=A0A835K1N8_9ROSI|nr:hypothetical protein SADUNF_Sadunf07G0074300 [Salix dunnii]
MTGKRTRVSPIGSPLSENISESSSKLEQDRFLPIANVSRIMKKSLPANAKISKEAKETVQECVSEFISFITGEASDKCQREKRKTINGDDLLWAMTILGFENYVGPLKVYLNKYRETEGEKNSMAGQEDQLYPTNHASLESSEPQQVVVNLKESGAVNEVGIEPLTPNAQVQRYFIRDDFILNSKTESEGESKIRTELETGFWKCQARNQPEINLTSTESGGLYCYPEKWVVNSWQAGFPTGNSNSTGIPPKMDW